MQFFGNFSTKNVLSMGETERTEETEISEISERTEYGVWFIKKKLPL